MRLSTFTREITVKVLFDHECTGKCKYRSQLVISYCPWDSLTNMPCREKRNVKRNIIGLNMLRKVCLTGLLSKD